jgi:hypothetical protein
MRELATNNNDEARTNFFRVLLAGRLIVPSPGLEASGLPMNTSVKSDHDLKIHISSALLASANAVSSPVFQRS